MPTYRSITLSLISQFDILTIPEYAPPATPTDPFCSAPTLINPDHSLVSVYIPTYPSSQFWLSYSISPPYPPKLLYYFKLYLNGNLTVSWGCGEEDGYKGKTMFGLFGAGQNSTKHSLMERRVLCFGPESGDADNFTPGHLSDVMEIRVFRSKGRKRIQPNVQEYRSQPSSSHVVKKGAQQHTDGGINLVNAGIIPIKHPQRYYKYVLLDPLDQPFATFRYYYRSWDQLEALGVISPTPSTDSSSIHSSVPIERRSSNNTIASSRSASSAAGIDCSPVESAINPGEIGIAITTEETVRGWTSRWPDHRELAPPTATQTKTPSTPEQIGVAMSTDEIIVWPRSREPATPRVRFLGPAGFLRTRNPPPAIMPAESSHMSFSTIRPPSTAVSVTSLEDNSSDCTVEPAQPVDEIPKKPSDNWSKLPPTLRPARPTIRFLKPDDIPRIPTRSPANIPCYPTPPLRAVPAESLHALITRAPNTLATKESFTTLVRTRLPSPDPSAFQLTSPLADPPQPPCPTRTPPSTNMGVLMSIVASARNRRKRGGSESPEGSSHAGGEPSENGGTRVVDPEKGKKAGNEEMLKENKMGRGTMSRDEKRKNSGDGSISSSGRQRGDRRNFRERKLNLWEEL